MKAATSLDHAYSIACLISIHAAREGGDRFRKEAERENIISIHAAREGGDEIDNFGNAVQDISIHAAREGGDSAVLSGQSQHRHFNPRRP